MVCNVKKLITFAIIYLCFLPFLFSQIDSNVTEKSSFSRSTQVITWEKTQYAKYYEITIEKNAGENWEQVETYSTNENALELHFHPGSYRYRITVYNLLNRAENPSEWFNFIIKPALQPRVDSIEPTDVVLDEHVSGDIMVVSENIEEGAIILLKHPNGSVVHGSVYDSIDGKILVSFDEQKLEIGNYVFSVTNPGGLNDSSRTFTVKKEKSYDLLFSLGYAPGFIVSGGNIVPFLPATFLPSGASFKFAWVPFKKSYGHFGIGLTSQAIVLNQQTESMHIKGYLFPLTASLVYKYPLIDKKLFFNAQLGFGTTILYGLNVSTGAGFKDSSLNAFALSPTAGLSTQFYFGENFFMDVGADYNAIIFIGDTYMQVVNPFISVGIKL